MQIKRNLLLILLCATVVPNTHAGWREWIQSFFGPIRRPSLTNKQMVGGGVVGALAIAGTVWGYKKWRQSKGPSSKNLSVGPRVSQQEEIPQEGADPETPKQKIIRLNEQSKFQVGDIVKFGGDEKFPYRLRQGHLGIVIEVSAEEEPINIAVDVIFDVLNTKPETLTTLRRQQQDFFEKVEVEPVQNKKIPLYQEVIVRILNDRGEKMPYIGRVIKQHDDKISVIFGSNSR